MQKAVGGYLEVVPHFHSIDYDGAVRKCVALCNEEGKLDRPATDYRTTRRDGYGGKRCSAITASVAPFPDYLVGNIVVLFGDREFMEAL